MLWCACWENIKTGETGDCIGEDSIKDFLEGTKGSVYIGHNIVKFDSLVINRMVLACMTIQNIIDTLVLSQLYSPNIDDGHSLRAWGIRMGMHKGDFHEFDKFSEEMLIYCRQDVRVTATLFRRLIKTMVRIGFSEQSMWIQHRQTELLYRQHLNGFYFDGARAIEFYQMLRRVEGELSVEIKAAFPPELEVIATYKKAHKKDGSPGKQYLQHLEMYERVELHDDDTYSVYGRNEFNIGSPGQRTQKLLDLGWVPLEFTEKTKKGGGGNPKPFDKGKLSPSLEKFLEDKDVPEVKLIARWMSVNGRANMVNTWLDNWNENDSCIHGKLLTADTLRLRHQSPNTANIPAVRVREEKRDGKVIAKHILYGLDGYFTYESRDLWTARPGRVLVGTDASGLELRMLAHYLNRPDFTDQVVNGDPHQYNADVVGITRPQAKTLIYAIMYGAAAPKIARTLGVSVKEGAYIRLLFLERLGLGKLIAECIREQEAGRILLVDGSYVVCPSPHAALNYKLQGGGARVMALGSIRLDQEVSRRKLDVLKVGDVHDEWILDTNKKCADEVSQLSLTALKWAGEKLKMNVPIEGNSLIGRSWAVVH